MKGRSGGGQTGLIPIPIIFISSSSIPPARARPSFLPSCYPMREGAEGGTDPGVLALVVCLSVCLTELRLTFSDLHSTGPRLRE